MKNPRFERSKLTAFLSLLTAVLITTSSVLGSPKHDRDRLFAPPQSRTYPQTFGSVLLHRPGLNLNPGDTLIIKPGIYTEIGALGINATAGGHITVIAQPGAIFTSLTDQFENNIINSSFIDFYGLRFNTYFATVARIYGNTHDLSWHNCTFTDLRGITFQIGDPNDASKNFKQVQNKSAAYYNMTWDSCQFSGLTDCAFIQNTGTGANGNLNSPMLDITISRCTFSNIFSIITPGIPINIALGQNIRITGCRFENIATNPNPTGHICCIALTGWGKIDNNYFTNRFGNGVRCYPVFLNLNGYNPATNPDAFNTFNQNITYNTIKYPPYEHSLIDPTIIANAGGLLLPQSAGPLTQVWYNTVDKTRSRRILDGNSALSGAIVDCYLGNISIRNNVISEPEIDEVWDPIKNYIYHEPAGARPGIDTGNNRQSQFFAQSGLSDVTTFAPIAGGILEDKGQSLPGMAATDFWGNARVSGAAVDIGAVERQSGVNAPPVAEAGNNITITLPTSTATLDGRASTDPDGTIVTFRWTMVTGPAAPGFVDATQALTNVNTLIAGNYTFRLDVTDNKGATAFDTVHVTVNTAAANLPPISVAGNDINLTLPTNNTTLNGTGSSDPDGTIAAYKWSKYSGPGTYSFVDSTQATTGISNLVAGSYVFRLTVTDNKGATAWDTIRVNVTGAPANQAPIANAGSNQTITLPTNSVTLNAAASIDNDGSIVSYNWTKISGPAGATIVSAGAVNTVVNNLVQGTYTFSVNVVDNGGANASATVVINVNPVAPSNLPPVAGAPDVTITLPTNTATLDGSTSTDPDGTIVSYAWTKISGPATFTLANAGAKIANLTALGQGVYIFQLIVTDNSGATNAKNVTVSVNSTSNLVPIANAGPTQSITLPTNAITISAAASVDNDGTIVSYVWTQIIGPPGATIVSPNNVTTIVNNLVQGNYVFAVNLVDNGGATAGAIVAINVNPSIPSNLLPVASAPDVTITLPANTATLDGSASSDPDGTIASYAWAKVSGPATFTLTNASNKIANLTGLVQGVYMFQLIVTDNSGATSSKNVTVTVNAAPNLVPIANAGPSQTITLPTSSVTLNAAASVDNDGSIVSYVWTQIAGPTGALIVNPNSVSTAVNNLVQGTYTFAVNLVDNGGATAGAIVVINVNPPIAVNVPPVASSPDISLTLPANSTALNGTASSDPDGTIVSYAWTKISGPASFNLTNQSTSIASLSGLVQGVYIFQLVVTDNNGSTNAKNVTVTVNAAANQAPVANAGSDQNITLPVNSVTLSGTASSDADGSIVSYSWSELSGPAATIATANASGTVVNNLVQGNYTFQLLVTDDKGASATATVRVVVNPAARPAPIANAGPDQNITLPASSVNVNGSGSSDAFGSIVGYSWTQVSGPAATIVNPNAASTAINNLAQGTYSFNLEVTNDIGVKASSVMQVTVNAAANVAPVSNAGANQTITLPVNAVTLDGTASSDPDGTITSYNWTKISGPSNFTLGNSGSASTSLMNLDAGTYVFSLTVTDNSGATASSNVFVTVYPAAPSNQVPVAKGLDESISLPTNSVILDASGSYDPDGTVGGYSWSISSGPAGATLTNPNSVSPVFGNLQVGTYVLNLTVVDNAGASASTAVTVVVNPQPAPVNQAPIANAGAAQVITLPTNAAQLDASGSSDPDGSIVNYSWGLQSGPAGASFSNPTAVNPVISGLQPGVYVFVVYVTDNSGNTSSSTVTITVNAAAFVANQAPIANAGTAQSITLPLNSVDLDGSASVDPDGTIVKYSWNKISGPGASTIVNADGPTPTASALVAGTYVFELTVTDNSGATNSSRVTITVNMAANLPPIADAGADISIPSTITLTQLDGTKSSDADGNIVTYSWKQLTGATATIVSPNSAISMVKDLAPGEYIFELTVTDNQGASAKAVKRITVIDNLRSNASDVFNLYPNPVHSDVTITWSNAGTGRLNIRVYDQSGKIVFMKQDFKTDKLYSKQLSFNQLSQGTYVLEIALESGDRHTVKFIKL